MPTKLLKNTFICLLLCASILSLSGCELRLGDPKSDQIRENERIEQTKQKELEKKNDEAMKLYQSESASQILAQEKTTDTTQSTSENNTVVQYSIDRPEGEPVSIININSLLIVNGGGTSPTVTFNQNYFLTDILTYHWNDGKGTPAGTIALKDSSGKTYGPWAATLESGVYWTAKPSVTIPAGTYTVIDSDPATWSQNSETGGNGVTTASGIPMR
jgi:hypothetical protein